MRCWGAGGRGRAGAGPCPPALRHRCSPNTPDLKRRFQLGAGGRGPVPPAPVTHSPGAWHPGRAPAPPTPPGCRGDARPASSPPQWGRPGPAAVATQQSGLVSARPPRRRGQRIPARGPRSGPAALGVPTQPPAVPGPRRGHGATPVPVVPRAGRGARAGAAPRGGSRGSHGPGNPSEAVGSSPGDKRRPPHPRRFLRGPELDVPGGRGGLGDPLSPRCPHSLHRHRHEAAASLQPREPLRDPAASLPGLPGGPGQPGTHLPARRRRHRLPQGARRKNAPRGGKDGGLAGLSPVSPHPRTSRRCRGTC